MRVYTVLEDDIARSVEIEAAKQGMTRSSWIAEAITKRLRFNQEGGDDLSKIKDDLSKARDDMNHLQAETDHLKDDLEHQKQIVKIKDDEIGFLRGHLSQISEILPKSLLPGEEEIKAKHWYQFWK